MRIPLALACSCLWLSACAAPPPADPGRSGVWGYVRLVPREGVAIGPIAGGGSPYADRRYADAQLVDYTRPGFAVVYLEGEPPSTSPLVLRVGAGATGVHFEPEVAALPVGGEITIENRGHEARLVTCPAAGLVERLAPGRSLQLRAERPGPLDLHLPGDGGATARVFAAPGPFVVVDGSGRYELLGIEPGRRDLHAWHPRFPPTRRALELEAGSVERLDLEMGVGLAREEVDAD